MNRGARLHDLKTDSEMWDALAAGDKTAEFRRNDRDYRVGDVLTLRRGTTSDEDVPSLAYEITHVVVGPAFGIPPGFALLSLSRLDDDADLLVAAKPVGLIERKADPPA